MNLKQRNEISQKSDNQLASDIRRYEKQISAIPKSMKETRISARKRLQAHCDELQTRLIKGAGK